MNPIKLPTLLQSIVAPQVIKSFILQQLDRLPPTTQQVAKECALVGEYFSRHIIYHLNSGKGTDSGHSTDKIDRAFQHLIDAKIIEPIRTQINMSRHAKVKIQIISKTPHIPNIDDISGAPITLNLSILKLNSQCEEGGRDGIDIWFMRISLIKLFLAGSKRPKCPKIIFVEADSCKD